MAPMAEAERRAFLEISDEAKAKNLAGGQNGALGQGTPIYTAMSKMGLKFWVVVFPSNSITFRR